MRKIVKRCEKLTFFGVMGENGAVVYHRMRGFNEITLSRNPIEYSRRYVDEEFEQSDVVGYSPSISFSFDQFFEDAVHRDLANIADNELIGESAVRSIIIVDLSQETESGSYPAIKREFSVILDKEGDSMDAYTYSGNLKVKGEKVFGTAESADNWETCSFIEA